MEFEGNNHTFIYGSDTSGFRQLHNGNGELQVTEEDEAEMYTCAQCCKVFVDKELLSVHQIEQHGHGHGHDRQSTNSNSNPLALEHLPNVPVTATDEEFILGFDNGDEQFLDEILQDVQMGAHDDGACNLWLDEEEMAIDIDGIMMSEADPSTSALQVQVGLDPEPAPTPPPPPINPGYPGTVSAPAPPKKATELRPTASTINPVIEELSREEVDRILKAKMLREMRERVARIYLEDIGSTMKVECKFCHKVMLLDKLKSHQQAHHSHLKHQKRLNGGVRSGGPSQRRCFKCSFCGKSFVAESQCKSHENTHKAEASEAQPAETPVERITEVKTEVQSESESQKPEQLKLETKVVENEGAKVLATPAIKIQDVEGVAANETSEFPKDTDTTLPRGPPLIHLPPLEETDKTGDSIPSRPASVFKRKKSSASSTRDRESSRDQKFELMKENYVAEGLDPNSLRTCLQCKEEVPLSELVPHIYGHVMRSQRQCALCEHRAHSLHDLKDHVTGRHYSLKPHVCSKCGSGFVWRSGLRGHEENCSGSSGSGKQFNCSKCKAKFRTNRERRRHELVHKSLKGPDGKTPAAPLQRINGGVLKTKHNILNKKQVQGGSDDTGSAMDSPNSEGSDPMSSPELTALLENYVRDSSEEHLIELDPMTDGYANANVSVESFLDSLTRPPSASNSASALFGGREETVAVAFAMTSTTGGSNGAVVDGAAPAASYGMQIHTQMQGQNSWPAVTPTPNMGVHPHPGGAGIQNHQHHHVFSNNNFVAPSLIQQPMGQPVVQHPAVFQGVPPGAYLQPPPQPHNADMNNSVVKLEPGLEDDGGGGEEDDDEDDDEYYRDEDKRYTEQPDIRTSETCKTCQEVVPMAELRAHIQAHVPKGQLECSICNYKAFNGKYLLDHLNIHYSLKPYECERCGRHFTFHGYLRSHIKQVHMQSKNRPHECRYCDKKFVRPCHRRTHERSHKGEIPKDKRPPSASASVSSTSTSTPSQTPPATPTPTQFQPAGTDSRFGTPIKRESFDMTLTSDLLSSPSPKLTSSWPPITPQQQDPWLNPIQQQAGNPGLPPQQIQQRQPHSAPSLLQQTLQYPPQSGNQGQNTYYASQPPAPPVYQAPQQQQSGYGQPIPHSQQPQSQVSQGPLPSFGSTYAQHAQSPQRFQTVSASSSPTAGPATWATPTPVQVQASPPRYNTGYMTPPSNSGGGPSNTFYSPAPAPQNPQIQPQPPSYPSSGGYQQQQTISMYGQPQPQQGTNLQAAVGPSMYAQSQPRSQQSDFGYHQQQQSSAPDYSISTPSTSTFDLWAELRDEELRLFPETNNLYGSSDPFSSPSHTHSFLKTDADPMLGSYFNEPPPPAPQSQQQQYNNYYGHDPFLLNPVTLSAPTQSPFQGHHSNSNSNANANANAIVSGFVNSSAHAQLQIPSRIKIKIRYRNGQSTLVQAPHLPAAYRIGGTSSSAGTSTPTATASRELIPAGGRRLSSDDLDDLQLTHSECLVCKASLSGGQDILEHIASHLPRGGTHCAICDRSFAHAWYLKVHTYKHYGIKLYECTYCHRKFSKRHSLTAHIEQTHSAGAKAAAAAAVKAKSGTGGQSQSECAICKKKFKLRFALRRHQKEAHPDSKFETLPPPGRERVAPGPNLRTYTPGHVRLQELKTPESHMMEEGSELELRLQEAHLAVFLRGWTVRMADIGNQTRECPICKEAVPIRDTLTHKTEHKEECHICGKEVPASEIISHGSTHVSSLYCELCNWKGKQKSQIWEHMNGHLGNKPLKCEYCGVGFASRSSVRLHTIARHTNIRLHKCDFCDARFVTPQVKRMHQLQHYDTNCPYCNKYFGLKKDLAVHIRRHYKMEGQKLVLKEEGDVIDDDEPLPQPPPQILNPVLPVPQNLVQNGSSDGASMQISQPQPPLLPQPPPPLMDIKMEPMDPPPPASFPPLTTPLTYDTNSSNMMKTEEN